MLYYVLLAMLLSATSLTAASPVDEGWNQRFLTFVDECMENQPAKASQAIALLTILAEERVDATREIDHALDHVAPIVSHILDQVDFYGASNDFLLLMNKTLRAACKNQAERRTQVCMYVVSRNSRYQERLPRWILRQRRSGHCGPRVRFVTQGVL